jgi:osmoprotectant transport system ATP-binding protein
LSLRTVGDFIRRGEHSDGEPLVDEMTLRDALSVFVARGCDVLPVVTLQGYPAERPFSRFAFGDADP